MTKGWAGLALVCVSCGGLTSESSGDPTQPTEPAELTLEAGTSSTCALRAGEVECWGQLDYSSDNVSAPAQVTPRKVGIPGEVTAMRVGGYHWCAQTADHSVWCWGMNNQGQVGSGPSDFDHPLRKESLDGRVAAVDAGTFNSCALTLDGEVYCWGYAGYGVVQGNDDEVVFEPQLIEGFGERVIQIDVGYRRACALTESHAVKCWGHEALGEFSYDDPHPFQVVQLPTLETGVERMLPMREQLMCALMQDHTVRCNGITFLFEVAPSQVVEIPGATEIVDGGAGDDFACFVTSAGNVACFGRADLGQLGVEPPETESASELQFPAIDSVEQISVGSAHVCVQNTAGAYCWGWNEFDQLGKQGSKFEWQPQPLKL